jgi:glyoxylase-like metal-dependent hydrolase (beta-lactamase superfamily II)
MTKPAPGVTTITLPMPWELETVNVHLVELNEGVLLIDSGIATEECFDAMEDAMKGCGIKWTDVRALCLTHLHPDHIGLSWRILDLTGARLIMHRAEAEYLALVARERRPPFFGQAMQDAGVPDELQRKIERVFVDVRRGYREHDPEWRIEHGESIPVRGGTLEAIWTPGHSPGHLCLYSPQHRYLISGDHLLEQITPNIAWHPEHDMLAQYLNSLKLLEPFDVNLVLPSHGGAFRGHRERIRETTLHHDERCGQILGFLGEGPLTAHALVAKVWPRTLSPFHHNFAVYEILAHLDYLERRGRVRAQENSGNPARQFIVV